MYFIRIDYIYRGGPVQRVRTIVSDFKAGRKLIDNYLGVDFLLLACKIERCV